MSVCFNSIDFNKSLTKSIVKYRYANAITQIYPLNKYLICEILKFMLSDYINITVYGYSSEYEEFWGKQIKQNNLLIYFTIKFCIIDNNTTKIIITPLVGDVSEYKKLTHIIKKYYIKYKECKLVI